MKVGTNGRTWVLGCTLLMLCSVHPASTQTRGEASDAALRALNQGKYDEVVSLLKGSTDRRAAALRARADIERGRYADALKILTPAAQAAPAGEAALELGLLQLYLG